MSLFVVEYAYGPDRATQDTHRADHRSFLSELADEGVLLVSGPFVSETRPGAMLILRCATPEEAREVLAADPFRTSGQVESVTVTAWNPVIGPVVDALVQG